MLESIRIVALFMAPFMPDSSQKIFEAIGQGDIEKTDNIKNACV